MTPSTAVRELLDGVNLKLVMCSRCDASPRKRPERWTWVRIAQQQRSPERGAAVLYVWTDDPTNTFAFKLGIAVHCPTIFEIQMGSW